MPNKKYYYSGNGEQKQDYYTDATFMEIGAAVFPTERLVDTPAVEELYLKARSLGFALGTFSKGKKIHTQTDEKNDELWESLGKKFEEAEAFINYTDYFMKDRNFEPMTTKSGRDYYLIAQNMKTAKGHYEYMKERLDENTILEGFSKREEGKKEIEKELRAFRQKHPKMNLEKFGELLKGWKSLNSEQRKAVLSDENKKKLFQPCVEFEEISNKNNDIEKEYREITYPGANKVFKAERQINDTISRLQDFYSRIDDGKNPGHKNSKEYTQMVDKLKEIIDQKPDNLGELDRKMEELRGKVSNYIDAKNAQKFHIFSSTQRSTRLAFASTLMDFASVNRAENNYILHETPLITEVMKNGRPKKELSAAEFLRSEYKPLVEKMDNPQKNQPQKEELQKTEQQPVMG